MPNCRPRHPFTAAQRNAQRQRLAETLRRAVEETATPDADPSGATRVTVSVCVATAFPAAGGQPADLVAAADAALYEAKAAGRNTTRAHELIADAVAVSA